MGGDRSFPNTRNVKVCQPCKCYETFSALPLRSQFSSRHSLFLPMSPLETLKCHLACSCFILWIIILRCTRRAMSQLSELIYYGMPHLTPSKADILLIFPPNHQHVSHHPPILSSFNAHLANVHSFPLTNQNASKHIPTPHKLLQSLGNNPLRPPNSLQMPIHRRRNNKNMHAPRFRP